MARPRRRRSGTRRRVAASMGAQDGDGRRRSALHVLFELSAIREARANDANAANDLPIANAGKDSSEPLAVDHLDADRDAHGARPGGGVLRLFEVRVDDARRGARSPGGGGGVPLGLAWAASSVGIQGVGKGSDAVRVPSGRGPPEPRRRGRQLRAGASRTRGGTKKIARGRPRRRHLQGPRANELARRNGDLSRLRDGCAYPLLLHAAENVHDAQRASPSPARRSTLVLVGVVSAVTRGVERALRLHVRPRLELRSSRGRPRAPSFATDPAEGVSQGQVPRCRSRSLEPGSRSRQLRMTEATTSSRPRASGKRTSYDERGNGAPFVIMRAVAHSSCRFDDRRAGAAHSSTPELAAEVVTPLQISGNGGRARTAISRARCRACSLF